jgi:hypothetical protein
MAWLIGWIRREWRARPIFVTLGICFGSLMVAVGAQQMDRRLAADPPVTATVRKAWIEHFKGPVQFARLVYDRKQPDGEVVHCDVPRVRVGYRDLGLKAGDTITIAPRPNTCWEPDIICETCAPPPPHLVSVLFVISAVSGLLFGLLVWGALRAQRSNAASNAA